MKKCSHYRTLLIDLLEDELSPAMREELLQHIVQCTQCALEYSRLQKLSEVMTQDEVALPREGSFETMKQRARQQAIRPRRNLLGRLAKVFVPACALAAALFMIFKGRGETVEMSIPVAHLLEDRDIAKIAMAAYGPLAFVAGMTEHCIANIGFLALPLFQQDVYLQVASRMPEVTPIILHWGFGRYGWAHNQLYTVLGNLIGGILFIGIVFQLVSHPLRVVEIYRNKTNHMLKL